MKKITKTLLTSVMIGGLSLSLASVSQARKRTTLNFGNDGIPKVGDPQQMNSTWEHVLSINVFEGLTTVDAKGKVIPGLAKSWETKNNGKKFIFHLRPNLKWSDGSVFSFQHLVDPKTAARYASLMFPIVNAREISHGKKPLSSLGVKKINTSTIEFTTVNPTPFFPGLITHATGDIIPKAVVLKYGTNWAKPSHIVSSGAYKIKSWVPSGKLLLTKNPYYYDAKIVKIQNVNVVSADNVEPLTKLFITNKLDTLNKFIVDRTQYIESKRPHTAHIYKYPGIWYMPINMKDPQLGGAKNTDVRHALAMSINRPRLLKTLKSKAQYTHTFVPEGVTGISHPVYPYWHKWSFAKRLATAKKIMAKHGYTKTHPLTFKIEAFNSPSQRKELIAIFSFWKKIGVKATMDVYEANTHYDNMEKKKFRMAFAGWVLDYNDAYDFLFLLNTKTGGANNYSGYNNPTFNKFFNLANKEGNYKKRGNLFVKAETQLMKDLPNIPLYYSMSDNLISPNILGYQDNVMDVHPIKYMSFK